MDINDLRGFSTVLVFIAFVGVCWWAFAPRRKKRFEEAANLPFADDMQHKQTEQSDASETASASSGNEKRDTL